MKAPTTWTEARIAELRRLALTTPVAAIAQALRTSESAIRMQCSRHGIVLRARAAQGRLSHGPGAADAPKENAGAKAAREANVYQRIMASGVFSAPGGVPFAALGNASCRWPVGDDDEAEALFCGKTGADVSGGRAYCAAHRRLAHRPSLARLKKLPRDAMAGTAKAPPVDREPDLVEALA